MAVSALHALTTPHSAPIGHRDLRPGTPEPSVREGPEYARHAGLNISGVADKKSGRQVRHRAPRISTIHTTTSPATRGVERMNATDASAEALDLAAGARVLDVAAGNGNATLAAARRFCQVTSTDYVLALLEKGSERAAAERLEVTFQEADAEALPFGDGSFDAVQTTFGVMFAPDHEKAAAELARVCRPQDRPGQLDT